jgi:hypothetical protein
MPHFLRVRDVLVHIPSVAQVFVGQDHISRSVITIFYQNRDSHRLEYAYGAWAEARKDEERLKAAVEEVKNALSTIPEYERDAAKTDSSVKLQ